METETQKQTVLLSPENLRETAHLMVRLKPEWWDIKSALSQLNDGTGWCLLSQRRVSGWLVCKWHPAYRTVEIECLGYDNQGHFFIGPELRPLVAHCETWAQSRKAVNVRFIIGSRGLSCHRRSVRKPWEVLRDVHAVERAEFDWFVSMGYIPSGILPEIYGNGHHGVMLVKPV